MSIISFRNSNSKLRIDRDNSENAVDIGYDISSMKDEWHFLTVVRNAGGYSASLDANSTLTPIINAGSDSVEYELIGAAGPQAMSGSIDSIRFYNVELPHSEITHLYDLRGQSGGAKQSTPQTEGYEVIWGQGRKALWAVYDKTYNPFTNTPKNTITASIKTINGMPTDSHNPLW